MQNAREHHTGNLVDSPLHRLVRDMNALGRYHVSRVPAAERLADELGGDLLAAVCAELDRLETGSFPLCSHARRVA